MPSDDHDEVEALTPAHRWQHRHHKHWPPQCRAGHTSLGGYNCKLDSHQLFVFCFILSCGDEQNIFLLERASSMPDSSKPRSIKSITWKWKWNQLKLKWEKREQQLLLFFYPDNEVTIITLVFFFIFSLQLCHSFYNFFTILQFRKQFHYSDKTALNIGTTLFPLHVNWFLRLQPTCTCSRSPCSALALVHQCLHLHLANWPCDCA